MSAENSLNTERFQNYYPLRQNSSDQVIEKQLSIVSDTTQASSHQNTLKYQQRSNRKNYTIASLDKLFQQCNQIQNQYGQTNKEFYNDSQSTFLKKTFTSQVSTVNSNSTFFKEAYKTKDNSYKQKPKNQTNMLCPQCQIHLQKELKWLKQKNNINSKLLQMEKQLQAKIRQLLIKQKIIHQLNVQIEDRKPQLCIIEKTLDLSIRPTDFEQLKGFSKSQNQCQPINIIDFQDCIKSYKFRCQDLQKEVKYLKIENRTLIRMKDELLITSKQLNRTKNQRDNFKRKLIVFNRQVDEQKESYGRNTYNRKSKKQMQRGFRKSSNQEVFDLSLTDPSISSKFKNQIDLTQQN